MGLGRVNPGINPVVLTTEMATLPRILHPKPLKKLTWKLAERDSLLLELWPLKSV